MSSPTFFIGEPSEMIKKTSQRNVSTKCLAYSCLPFKKIEEENEVLDQLSCAFFLEG